MIFRMLGALTLAATMIGASGPATAADAWSEPQRVSVPRAVSDSPAIAASSDGRTVIVAWVELAEGGNTVVQASASTDFGMTWSAPRQLSASGRSADFPKVAMSSDGARATVVWSRSNGLNYIIQATSTDDSGGVWSPPVDLSVLGGSASYPRVFTTADGLDASVVWIRYNGVSGVAQFASSRDGGDSWQAAIDLSDDAFSVQEVALVGARDSDLLLAAWTLRDQFDDLVVQTSRSSDGGRTWTVPTNRSAQGTEARRLQLSASDDADRQLLGWRSIQGQDRNVLVRSSSNGGQVWALPFFPTVGGAGLGVHTSGDGTREAVSWLESGGAESGWLRTRESGRITWADPVRVTGIDAPVTDMTLDWSRNGQRSIAAWEAYVSNDDLYEVRASTSANGGGAWSAQRTVSAISRETPPDPQLAVSDSGRRATLAWVRSDGTSEVVEVARLISSPSAPTIRSVRPGDGSLSLEWTAPSDDGASRISAYEYQLNEGSWIGLNGLDEATISGLTNGSTYSVRVRARNAAGAGVPSASVNAMPGAAPTRPKSIKIKTFSKRITARWKSSADAFRVTLKGKKRSGAPLSKAKRVTRAKATFKVRLKVRSKVRVCVTARNDFGKSPKRCKRVRVR